MNRLQQSRRQSFGYVYPPQVNNSIITARNQRNPYQVMESQFKTKSNDDMNGEGVMDMAMKLYEKGKAVGKIFKKGAEKAVDLYGSEIGTTVKNLIPSSDDTARPAFAGERHAILELPNGKYGIANYMGPGTQVIKRLQRNDPPRTKSDKVAMRHDIDYSLAAGMRSKDAQTKAIREADQRMVNSLNRIANEKSDSAKNIFMGRRLIQGKMAAEDVGLMKKGSFGGDLTPISDKDKILLMSKRAGLSQEGYGLPAQALKMKLIRQMRKKKGKGFNPAGKGFNPAGKGISIPVGRGISIPVGRGVNTAGGRISKGKSYGTSKGHPMKGGFWFLAPLIALIAEALSGVTVASVGAAVATGAATAVGAAVTKKIIGGGKMKGKGVKEIAKKVSSVINKHKEKIINIAENTNVVPKDLPKKVLDQAQKALDVINQASNGAPSKEKVLEVAKMMLPHIKAVFHSKMENKMSGNGLRLAGAGIDEKVLSVVSKNL